jgi:hypothetical protein
MEEVAPQTTLLPDMEVAPQTTLVAPHTTEVLDIAFEPQTTEFPQTTDVAPQTTLVPPKAALEVFTIETVLVVALKTAVGESANPVARSVLARAESISR